MTRQRGFTLIELLIVIAIILILIAIALPNFLDAQVRARVARASSDMRSLEVALESYRIDWPHYPPCFDTASNSYINTWLERLVVLTTPHAYLTEIPSDPFFHPRALSWPDGDQLANYDEWEVYSYAEDYFGPYWSPSDDLRGLVNPYGNDVTWCLTSIGPDGELNFEQALDPSMPAGSNLYKLYAPTNGTKSEGDILRYGGESGGGQCGPSYWTEVRKMPPVCP